MGPASPLPLIDLPPKAFAYNAAIAKLPPGQWTQALALMALMRRARVEPNVITRSASMSSCEKAAAWRQALELFSDIQSDGLEYVEITCNTAISACSKGEEWQRAQALLASMRNRGLEPNRISYGAAVVGCSRTPLLRLQLVRSDIYCTEGKT